MLEIRVRVFEKVFESESFEKFFPFFNFKSDFQPRIKRDFDPFQLLLFCEIKLRGMSISSDISVASGSSLKIPRILPPPRDSWVSPTRIDRNDQPDIRTKCLLLGKKKKRKKWSEKRKKDDANRFANVGWAAPSVHSVLSVKTECQATIPREIRIFHQGGRRREDRRGIAKNENSGPGSIWYRCSPLYIIRTSLTGLPLSRRQPRMHPGNVKLSARSRNACAGRCTRGKKLKSSPPS